MQTENCFLFLQLSSSLSNCCASFPTCHRSDELPSWICRDMHVHTYDLYFPGCLVLLTGFLVSCPDDLQYVSFTHVAILYVGAFALRVIT